MFQGAKQLYSGEIYLTSSVFEGEYFGTLGQDQYGDLYRYTKVGAVAVTAGKLQLAPVQKTNHHNRPATAAVTADGRVKKVTLTMGATAVVADEYAMGYLVANDNAPEGVQYRVTGHPAALSAATLEVTVDHAFVESITTASEFTLVHNAWNGVVEGTAITQRAAGVPLVDGAIGAFGWVKTRGVASVLIGTAATLGAPLIVGGTSGSVTDQTDNLGASAEPVVAVSDIVLGVSTEFSPVRLVID